MISTLLYRSGIVLAAAGSQGAFAQCDINGDGHPLFGSTFVRADHEFIDGSDEFAAGHATHVTFGDLDGDGDADMVFAIRTENDAEVGYVSFALNRGDGVFDRAVHLAYVDQGFTSVALGDFDADGDPDIAAASPETDLLIVFFNLGGGEFGEGFELATQDRPISCAADDLDGDGIDDIVVLNQESRTLNVYVSAGDGGFEPMASYDVFGVTQGFGDLPIMAIADIDEDGDVDVLVPSAIQIRVMRNQGDGSFVLTDRLPIGGKLCRDVAAADLDGDGDTDLAAVSKFHEDRQVSVLVNEGGGVFAPAVDYEVIEPGENGLITSVASGDVNGDGAFDLVVCRGGDYYAVLPNLGDASFGPPARADLSDEYTVLGRLADLNGDGAVDLVNLVQGSFRGTAHLRLHDGQGGFHGPSRQPPVYPVPSNGGQAQHVELADLDDDGDLDGVVGAGNAVLIRENLGDGTFEPAGFMSLLPAPSTAHALGVGDVNGDGLIDVVAIDTSHSSIPSRVFVGLGDGALGLVNTQVIDLDGVFSTDVELADLDEDGDLDAVLWCHETTDQIGPTYDRRILTLINDGTGTFTSGVIITYTIKRSSDRGGLVVGDVNGDGHVDVISIATHAPIGIEPEPSEIYVFLGDGAGALEVSQVIETPSYSLEPRLGDMDADGDLDLVHALANTASVKGQTPGEYVRVLSNDGSGVFTLSVSMIDVEFAGTHDPVLADLDSDGRLDVALPNWMTHARVHLNDGTGHLAPGADSSTNYRGVSLAAGDIDDDDRTDLVLLIDEGHSLVVLGNLDCECPADFNGDGTLNVLDFVSFQLAWQAMDERADCDGNGAFDLLDFVCFQGVFDAGCD